MNLEEFQYAFKNLMSRKLRSWLNTLSILIGVMSIYALISFGLGIQNYIDVVAAESGTDKLFIQARSTGAPGTDDNFFISADDVNFVEKIKGVAEISGLYMKIGQIKHKKEDAFAFIAGMDPKKISFLDESFTVTVEKGRHLKKGDVSKAVVGYNYQFDNKIFKRGIELGDKVEVNGKFLEVIGFYEKVGNPQDDSNIYLTFEGMELLFPDIKDKFGYAMVRAGKGEDPEELADKIQEKLRKYKGQDEGKEDFYVQTFADAVETFGIVINILNGILVLIALISMLVASVNIMNTMYTAVLERTSEIGVMKSIGATNNTILSIFITEAGLLGLLGGILGVFFGYLVASAGGSIAASAGYDVLYPIFPWYLTFGCLAFAFFVGAMSGYLPARHASKLKPVDALRYE